MKQVTDTQQTVFCDFDHPAVLNLAKELANGVTDAREITKSVFKHVRDNIRFGFDQVQVKASETLEKGYGVCWNKALLMVALLRANEIPARLSFNSVKREFMQPAMGDACQTLTETMNHCFAQVMINGEWICVDPTLDALTYKTLFAPYEVSWGINWDGNSDLRLYTENIAGPVDYFDDIDAAIKQDVGNLMPPLSEADAFFGAANQQMWAAVDDKKTILSD